MSRFRRAFVLLSIFAAFVVACSWDPTRPFDREAPQVNEALGYYDAGEAGSAAAVLQDYLATGGCQDGNIGTPLRVRERSNGSFDLGLALFKIAETYGQRFGEEEIDAGLQGPNLKTLRSGQVECALRIVRAIAEDPRQPISLRARARYLEGNLLFLTAEYKEAVTAYERALELAPGMNDAGPIGTTPDSGQAAYGVDPIGRDAAENRAIALRRIEDKKDAGQPDASPPHDGGNDDNSNDGGQQSPDGGNDDKNQDAGDDKNKTDAGGGKDSGSDDQNKKPPPKDEPDARAPEPPPPSRQSQDERILDQLENAPTVQQEAAKQQAKAHRVRGMADK